MFLRNRWYVAAYSNEVTRKPLARTLLDEKLVLYRTEAGEAVLVEDTCPHRFAPLSLGTLVGNSIQCPYHGVEFGPNGHCTRIPGQSQIPGALKIRSYPTYERRGWIFAWMGESEMADPALLPHWPWQDDPDWDTHVYYFHVKGNYQLIIDNLLDLSHVTFVHKSTVADPKFAETPAKVEVDGEQVRNIVSVIETDAPPLFTNLMKGYKGKIDRNSVGEFTPPAYINVSSHSYPHGEPDSDLVIRMKTQLGCATPETATSTHFFVSQSRDFALRDHWVTDMLRQLNNHTVLEDVVMMNAQQAVMDAHPERRTVALKVDGAGIQARRVMERLIREEEQQRTAAVSAKAAG